jgi:hypothetical protein
MEFSLKNKRELTELMELNLLTLDEILSVLIENWWEVQAQKFILETDFNFTQ